MDSRFGKVDIKLQPALDFKIQFDKLNVKPKKETKKPMISFFKKSKK